MTSLADALSNPAGGIERAFNCPVHGDNHPSASVNIISGLWFCYTCGAKGKAGDGYTVDPDALLSWLKGLKQEYDTHYFPESWLNLFTAGDVHEYWLGRFSEAACRHFELGYDEQTESATYPVRDASGHLLGVVRRPLSPDWDGGKYIYPRHIDVSKYLFNYSQLVGRRRVLLVEGAADAIAAWEAGYEAYAIYGSRLSERQVQLLRRVNARKVYTAFDRDEAGDKAHNRCLDLIKDVPVRRVDLPDYAKDLAEMTVSERVLFLSHELGESDHERVVSTTCESLDRQDQQASARNSLSATSTPGPSLRIIRSR